MDLTIVKIFDSFRPDRSTLERIFEMTIAMPLFHLSD
jgi:hypothetical protein